MEELMSRWFLRAATGHKGSPLRRAVKMTVALSSLVDFVHGMSKLAEQEPSRSTRNKIVVECST